MDNTELNRKIQAGEAMTVIDVRSSAEYDKGHVPGAVHMPFWKAFVMAKKLNRPQQQTVVVYCEHGPRAWIAKQALKQAGFAQVLYLTGHMAGWRKAGLPVETPK